MKSDTPPKSPPRNTNVSPMKTGATKSYCFRIEENKMIKLRTIAYKENLRMKDLYTFVIDQVIESYERKHGTVKVSVPKPKGKVEEILKLANDECSK